MLMLWIAELRRHLRPEVAHHHPGDGTLDQQFQLRQQQKAAAAALSRISAVKPVLLLRSSGQLLQRRNDLRSAAHRACKRRRVRQRRAYSAESRVHSACRAHPTLASALSPAPCPLAAARAAAKHELHHRECNCAVLSQRQAALREQRDLQEVAKVRGRRHDRHQLLAQHRVERARLRARRQHDHLREGARRLEGRV